MVDGADLALLLGSWGGSGAGDLNADATIDGADLMADLRTAWPRLTRAERIVLLRVAQEAREHCGRLERAVGAAADAARLRGAP